MTHSERAAFIRREHDRLIDFTFEPERRAFGYNTHVLGVAVGYVCDCGATTASPQALLDHLDRAH